MNLKKNRRKPVLLNSLSTKSIPKQCSYSTIENITKSSFRNASTIPASTKPSKSIEDFNFLFKDDINSFNNSNNQFDIIRKLNIWDREHLNINSVATNSKLKKHVGFKGNLIKTKSVIDQGQVLRSHRKKMTVKIQDLFDDKRQDKQPIRYNPKSSFDYSVFSQNSLPIVSDRVEGSNDHKTTHRLQFGPRPTINAISSEMTDGKNYTHYLFEKKRTEALNRSQLMDLYYRIVIQNFKKEKCEGILDDAYKLLEEAREENSMINNILREKIKKNEDNYKKTITDLIQSKTQSKKTKRPLPNVIGSNYNQPMTTQTIEDKDNDCNEDESQVSNETKTITSSKGMSNNLFNNKKPNNARDSMHDKLRLYLDYVKISDGFNEKAQENNNQFKDIKIDLSQLINENKLSLEGINQTLFQFKTQFESQTKNQKAYYLSLLKQGIDTRNEGLTWIVKRLLELNVSLDSSNFPPYLDADQIDYLKKKSLLEGEAYKLRSLLKTIKIRKQTLANEDNFKRLEQFASIPIEMKATNTNIVELKRDDSTKKLRDYLVSKFKSLYSKHEAILKKSKEQVHEDVQIEHILRTIKDRINQYAAYGKIIFDESLEEVKEYYQHQNQKEYFEDIKELRKRLDDIDIEIGQLRENEAEMFKRKYHYVKTRLEGDKANAYYENVYNALFGTRMLSHS